jgi:spore maturation protein CgeB
MRVVIFCHSIISDWNHGNAHFLRGIATELISLGHTVNIYEPYDAWSVANLVRGYGTQACDLFRHFYPHLTSNRYDPEKIDIDKELHGTDLVLVHEWNDPKLIRDIALVRKRADFVALFHDTHHRMASAPGAFSEAGLEYYDGILVFGQALADLYRVQGFRERLFVWHEAADTRIFQPHRGKTLNQDLVWIGNWGDEERTAEIKEYLLEPVRRLGISASLYGVRYPEAAIEMLRHAGIRYMGWTPNFNVPRIFAESRLTIHIPRRPYCEMLPGIPTIRVFEALACGIPLISTPWNDSEELFRPGDYISVRDPSQAETAFLSIINDPEGAAKMAARGLKTVLERHTCAHRVRQLMDFFNGIRNRDWSLAYAS